MENQVEIKLVKMCQQVINDMATTALRVESVPEFNTKDLINATILFQWVLNSQMFKLILSEGIDHHTGLDMSENLGKDLRKLIKTYTDVDTLEAIKEM